MKFLKKKGDTSTIRMVRNEVDNHDYGLVGTVADLLAAKVFDFCECEKPANEVWAFVPVDKINMVRFADTRESACFGLEG